MVHATFLGIREELSTCLRKTLPCTERLPTHECCLFCNEGNEQWLLCSPTPVTLRETCAIWSRGLHTESGSLSSEERWWRKPAIACERICSSLCDLSKIVWISRLAKPARRNRLQSDVFHGSSSEAVVLLSPGQGCRSLYKPKAVHTVSLFCGNLPAVAYFRAHACLPGLCIFASHWHLSQMPLLTFWQVLSSREAYSCAVEVSNEGKLGLQVE